MSLLIRKVISNMKSKASDRMLDQVLNKSSSE